MKRCTVDFSGIEESNPKNWKTVNSANSQLKRQYTAKESARGRFEGLRVGAKRGGRAVVHLKKGFFCTYTILKGGGTVVIETDAKESSCPT